MNLQNLNLVELNAQEVQEVDGGVNWTPWGVAAAIAVSAFENWGDIREGFSDGINGRKPRYQS